MNTYRRDQLEKTDGINGCAKSIKIWSDGEHTNQMDITEEEYEQIKAILIK